MCWWGTLNPILTHSLSAPWRPVGADAGEMNVIRDADWRIAAVADRSGMIVATTEGIK